MRECRRASPPKKLGHKSNRKILNETAELLGLSLRMTEDQLTRKNVAGVKSSLIDLEVLPLG